MEILLLIGIVLVGILLYRVSALSKRLNSLEWKLKDVESLARSATHAAADTAPSRKPAQEPVKKAAAVASPVSPQQTPSVQPRLFIPGPEKPSRTREEWEALIGGKLLNRIGALALILGVGFFLKYAFDNNWISETVRVLIGGFIGFAALAGAYRARQQKLEIFAQGLVGAGAAILYLSVYAAFNFYHLIPQLAAFVLMTLVTALTLGQALYYDAFAIGLLGWAGGFLTPIMLSTGVANEPGLFTYIALLALGLLAVSVQKPAWYVLHPLTLFGTWAMFWLWYVDDYSDTKFLLTMFFAVVFWALFFGAEIVDILASDKSHPELSHIVASVNGVMLFGAVYTMLNALYADWEGAATLAIGGAYFGTFQVLRRRVHVPMDIALRFTLASVLLLITATALQCESYRIPFWWSVEAAALCWCSVRWSYRPLRFAATVLFGLVVLRLLGINTFYSYIPREPFTLIGNWRFGTLTVLSASLAMGAFVLRRVEEDRLLPQIFAFAGAVVFGVALSVELNDFFRMGMQTAEGSTLRAIAYARSIGLTVLWGFYALPLVRTGLSLRFSPLIAAGLIWLGAGVTVGCIYGISFVPLERFVFVMNVRALQMVLLLGATIATSIWVSTRSDVWDPLKELLPVLQVGAIVIAFVLLSGETFDAFQHRIEALADQQDAAEEVTQLRNLQQLFLSSVWLVYSFVLMGMGLWKRRRGLRLISIGLFGVTILKIFGYDLSFLETLYRIFSFIGLSIILFAVSFAYQRWKGIILEQLPPDP